MIHADLRTVVVAQRGARFKPFGSIETHGGRGHGDMALPRTGNRLLAARFFVGFNVDGKPHWTQKDLIRMFTQMRQRQGRTAGATFMTQRGIWQPVGAKLTPDEKGAQVVVLNEDQLNKPQFIREMVDIGEELARRMKQGEIFLDIQKAGVVDKSFTVTGD